MGSCFCHGHGLVRAELHPSPSLSFPLSCNLYPPGMGVGVWDWAEPPLLQLPGCAVHHLQLLSASERGNKQLSGDE